MKRGIVEAFINPKVQFELRLSAVNQINELISRDEAKPAIKKTFTNSDIELLNCPVCEDLLMESNNFCPWCGQRIDKENIAL